MKMKLHLVCVKTIPDDYVFVILDKHNIFFAFVMKVECLA